MNDVIDNSAAGIAVSPADVSALLQHLQRCGIKFLPRSDRVPQRVDSPELQAASLPSAAPRGAAGAPAAATTSMSPPAAAYAADAPAGRPSTPVAARSAAVPPAQPALISVAGPYPGPSLSLDQRILRLDALAREVSVCPRCEVLACNRKTTVFGEGDPQARVCFFGEAPGADEDATGRPFVGRAGMLLTKMIEACTLSRQEVYILNTVKCRPPGNRNPTPAEIANCRPYFEQQLDSIRPEYIVCLGLVAAQTLLGSTLSIGRLRGRFHAYHESKVLATYHPAYLLRNPDAKREAWADLKMLMRDMGIQVER